MMASCQLTDSFLIIFLLSSLLCEVKDAPQHYRYHYFRHTVMGNLRYQLMPQSKVAGKTDSGTTNWASNRYSTTVPYSPRTRLDLHKHTQVYFCETDFSKSYLTNGL